MEMDPDKNEDPKTFEFFYTKLSFSFILLTF